MQAIHRCFETCQLPKHSSMYTSVTLAVQHNELALMDSHKGSPGACNFFNIVLDPTSSWIATKYGHLTSVCQHYMVV